MPHRGYGQKCEGFCRLTGPIVGTMPHRGYGQKDCCVHNEEPGVGTMPHRGYGQKHEHRLERGLCVGTMPHRGYSQKSSLVTDLEYSNLAIHGHIVQRQLKMVIL